MFCLSGCTTYKPLVEKDYKGEIAYINDTYDFISRFKGVEYYFLEQVDGVDTKSVLDLANKMTRVQDLTMGYIREVPVRKMELTLSARIYRPFSFQEQINSITGRITFSSQAGQYYTIKGQLSDHYRTLWLEDLNGKIVSNIIKQAHNIEEKFSFNNKEKIDLTTPEYLFSNITSGENVAVIEAKFGKPDSISKDNGRLRAIIFLCHYLLRPN